MGNGITFTERDKAILCMIAHGMTNKTIASSLQITERTVEFHLGKLFLKMKVKSRVQAAVLATQWGMLDDENTRGIHSSKRQPSHIK